MIYTDYTEIKKVSFKVPEIMKENAEEEVISLFNKIKSLKEEISDLRMKASELEKEQKTLEEKWSIVLPLLDLEFETKEKEEVKGEINIGFNFGTEINKHIH